MSKKTVTIYALSLCLMAEPVVTQALTPSEELGKSIFFDENLSVNGNQACAACHAPEAGWTGPDSALNAAGTVYEGSISGRFGNRKPPSSAYASPSPVLHYVIEKKDALFIGGNFWDGRATGEKLGNPAADQAQGPFLNPLEQALAAPADVVSRVCGSSYASLFKQVWGSDACDPDKVDAAFDRIARSVADFEASPESNAFTSKYDYYLKGVVKLTKQEKKGLNLFKGKGKCVNCHVVDPGPNGQPPLFTDFTYDNIGVPRNPDNPFYTQSEFNAAGFGWIDLGLGEFLANRSDYQQFAPANLGKQKVPTLRNVDKRPYEGFVKAFAHNGYFKSLKGIVHFYNTRDAKPTCLNPFTTEADALAQDCWPAPEVPVNVNTDELGNLHLTDDQEDAIVAFLKTLSDGYHP
ncbi:MULTISPECIES: cytochrome-c peroxidase [Methylocaldum]|jgi:cytochrome c peroxidase|uniref:cytochrome-c peroxidase n=1 Tax=unclassified Methylocaldum TaxID=2622260 RepID=UPI000A31FE9A|nr:cytochrome c peroxidase [Methylocaldum sp. RMAD-M]MBP1153012.1 cytochrome c peroxidase [Methylocaldum sp. RMAD-M]